MENHENEPKIAGVIAPPPVLFISTLAVAFAFQALWPWPIAVGAPLLRGAAMTLMSLGVGLALWAFVTMRRAGTTPDPRKPSTALTTHGPYRLTRNPIYLAMTGFYVAIALLGRSWWPMLMLPLLVWVMHWGVIVREERYLARLFETDYQRYKERTRRWL